MHLALCTSGVLRAGGSRCFRSLLPAPSPAIPHIHGGGVFTSGRPAEVSGRAQRLVRGGPVSALAMQAGNGLPFSLSASICRVAESSALPVCWAGGRAQGPGHGLRSGGLGWGLDAFPHSEPVFCSARAGLRSMVSLMVSLNGDPSSAEDRAAPGTPVGPAPPRAPPPWRPSLAPCPLALCYGKGGSGRRAVHAGA